MRFHENDAAKWLRRPTLKSHAQERDVLHHNTLNARHADADDVARSREVERFFDLMTASTSTSTAAHGTRR